MNIDDVRQKLFDNCDEKYKKFHENLVPGKDKIIGVRVPVQKEIAQEIVGSDEAFEYLNKALKSKDEYYEEVSVQGLVIGYVETDPETKLTYIKKFIPKIDNWAICDTFCSSLKFTKKNKKLVWEFIMPYLISKKEYELRFAAIMLMDYYTDEEYIDRVLEIYNKIKHEGYYVMMGVAWGLSVCFVKHPEKTMRFFKNNALDDRTYNKAIQKIIESRRVDDDIKEKLRRMKRK